MPTAKIHIIIVTGYLHLKNLFYPKSVIRLSDGVSFEIFEICPVEIPVIFTTAYDERKTAAEFIVRMPFIQ